MWLYSTIGTFLVIFFCWVLWAFLGKAKHSCRLCGHNYSLIPLSKLRVYLASTEATDPYGHWYFHKHCLQVRIDNPEQFSHTEVDEAIRLLDYIKEEHTRVRPWKIRLEEKREELDARFWAGQ